MAKRTRVYTPQTVDAASVLGTGIARAIRDRRWTAAELAERVGVSTRTVSSIEHGSPTVAIGVVLEAATLLGVPLFGVEGREMAMYPDPAASVRARFTDPIATLHELFARIVVNVCVGNTDDHARNHAAFCDGRALTLTPAHDLCPQPRSGQEAAQSMAIGRDGARASQLRVYLAAAARYRLEPA